MGKVKNLEEAKALVEKYRDIVNNHEDYDLPDSGDLDYDGVLYQMTGFGKMQTCTLCKAVYDDCSVCIHSTAKIPEKIIKCLDDKYLGGSGTYDAIFNADDTDSFLDALNNRANYLETLINKYNENEKN